MKVPFMDLRVTDARERAEVLEAVGAVLDHGRLLLGPEVARLEQEVARACGTAHAVGVGSGTDALTLALRALEIGPGDEVITTPLSFIATGNAIALTGATPVFADIGEDLNLDPESIEPVVTDRTRAVVPVHFTGRPCAMEQILAIAGRHKLAVVEDACQAFGARWKGKPVGSFGTLGCLSLNPMKVFAGCGEAGMILCGDPEMRRRLEALPANGLVDKETSHWVSHNGRIDTLQAAILLTRLGRVAEVISARRRIAAHYDRELKGIVETPPPCEDGEPIPYSYTLQTADRGELLSHLTDRGVEAKIHHRLLIPQHPVFADRAAGHSPNAERLVKRILCLPCNEKLKEEQVTYVTDQVKEFFSAKSHA